MKLLPTLLGQLLAQNDSQGMLVLMWPLTTDAVTVNCKSTNLEVWSYRFPIFHLLSQKCWQLLSFDQLRRFNRFKFRNFFSFWVKNWRLKLSNCQLTTELDSASRILSTTPLTTLGCDEGWTRLTIGSRDVCLTTDLRFSNTAQDAYQECQSIDASLVFPNNEAENLGYRDFIDDLDLPGVTMDLTSKLFIVFSIWLLLKKVRLVHGNISTGKKFRGLIGEPTACFSDQVMIAPIWILPVIQDSGILNFVALRVSFFASDLMRSQPYQVRTWLANLIDETFWPAFSKVRFKNWISDFRDWPSRKFLNLTVTRSHELLDKQCFSE